MKKNLLWAVTVIAAALIQTAWLDAVRVQGVLPDLTLLLVVYFALADGEERAMFTGVLGGMYQDVAGNAVLGHHILCHVLVGYVVGRVAARLITEHPAVKTVFVFGASLLHGALFTAILYVQQPGGIRALHTLAASVIPEAFYTALVTPAVFFVLARSFHPPTAVQEEAV